MPDVMMIRLYFVVNGFNSLLSFALLHHLYVCNLQIIIRLATRPQSTNRPLNRPDRTANLVEKN